MIKIKQILKLISDIIYADRYNDMFRGLYIKEKLPKTYGSRIKRK